jgi:hypothetical protein
MAYKLKVSEKIILNESTNYVNKKGNRECAFFVQKVTGAPQTLLWERGIHVVDAKSGSIPRGTAIATFDESGHYPVDLLGQHAAIYLYHDSRGIRVLDQWNSKKDPIGVSERTIRFKVKPDTKRSNDSETFYVIE